ncbi:MAG: tetraether lipid synthase Tes [Pseudomonadota bacterium]
MKTCSCDEKGCSENKKTTLKNTQIEKEGLETTYGKPRPAHMDICQPEITHTGCKIEEVSWTLPYWTNSLCPECTKVIKARKFIADNKVYLEKECEEHGYFKELLSPDAELYMSIFTNTRFGDQRGFSNPQVKATDSSVCPENCGICGMHHSHTCMSNIDLTNRCDMRCPVCYANAHAAGYIMEPTFDEVVKMLEGLRNRKPVSCKTVQFSGGEPTIHPRFVDILKKAKELGFNQIQIATNGKNLSDYEFAKRCKEAGLNTLYLQFDGVTPGIYRKTRAEDVYDLKLRTIEICRKVGLKIVLVPTLIRGLNDNQVGAIVKFACDNSDAISGISFQPICFTGRISEKDREKQRYTITDLALDIDKQTNGMIPKENWLNLNCLQPFSRIAETFSGNPAFYVSCHPDCGAGGFVFINPEDHSEVKAVCDFFDIREALTDLNNMALDLQEKATRGAAKFLAAIGLDKPSKLIGGAKVLMTLNKHFHAEKAPTGLTFRRMLGVIDGYKDIEHGRKSDTEKTTGYNTIFVAGMHFQDVYNYDTERTRRCVIHHMTPEGKMYPFCTYNSGPYYRAKVEEKMQHMKPHEYKENGDIHASATKNKNFKLPSEVPTPKKKDYGITDETTEYNIPENYGCCSTAKG